MIEFTKVNFPEQSGIRSRNRIFHHRGTENTEKENNLAGEFSPSPPFLKGGL